MSNMTTRDDKKRKREKEKEGERFDPNIDTDLIRDSSSVSSSPKRNNSTPVVPAHSSSNGGSSDFLALGKILEKGFQKVSDNITHKLDTVSNNLSEGLSFLQSNLDKRMTELSEFPVNEELEDAGSNGDHRDCDDAVNWDNMSDVSMLRRQHLGDHVLSDSSSATSSGGSFFKKKNKPPPEEKVGDEVDSDLADIANRCFRKPFSEDDFKNYKEKYVRPKNVEWITTPEIPFNIYRRLSGDFKSTDSTLRGIQEHLVPVTSSLIYALDKLDKGDMNEGMETLSDTLQGLGYVFKSKITDKRRSLLKPKLPEDFKVLVTDKCSPSPNNLLGDISENTKKISETDKITTQMDKSSKPKENSTKKPGGQQNRGKPYDRNSRSSNYSNRRGGFFNRRYDNQRRSSNDNRSDTRSNNSSFRRGGQYRR